MTPAPELPGVVEATRSYERWLRGSVALNPGDLRLKHERMAASPLAFLRGSFYRFMQRWPALGRGGHQAPVVPSVGDLHLENYGTWRDVAGRLVWGINDFDEAAPLPYTLDLLRLMVSVRLAAEAGDLTLPLADVTPALLDGYREGLTGGGRPFVLEAEHGWLRAMITAERDTERYWRKLLTLPPLATPAPPDAVRLLQRALPVGGQVRFVHRTPGLGSLGRPRVLALTEWLGGPLALEAKALAPSAAVWALGTGSGSPSGWSVPERAVRCPDPSLSVQDGYLLRRLSPSVQRLDLADLSGRKDERRLLRAMRLEAANIHLGAPEGAAAVLKDLEYRGNDWFAERATQGVREVREDWTAWKQR